MAQQFYIFSPLIKENYLEQGFLDQNMNFVPQHQEAPECAFSSARKAGIFLESRDPWTGFVIEWHGELVGRKMAARNTRFVKKLECKMATGHWRRRAGWPKNHNNVRGRGKGATAIQLALTLPTVLQFPNFWPSLDLLSINSAGILFLGNENGCFSVSVTFDNRDSPSKCFDPTDSPLCFESLLRPSHIFHLNNWGFSIRQILDSKDSSVVSFVKHFYWKYYITINN